MPAAAVAGQMAVLAEQVDRALVVLEEALAVMGQMLQMQIPAVAAAELGHRDLGLHLETVALAL
jgi:hypothetical protein